jgi:uncharacterized protein YjbI with pentapeptide repeats
VAGCIGSRLGGLLKSGECLVPDAVQVLSRATFASDGQPRPDHPQQARQQFAHLQRADLRGAVLRGADLRGADLRDACLDGADFTGVRLDGVEAQGASTVNLTVDSSAVTRAKSWPTTATSASCD